MTPAKTSSSADAVKQAAAQRRTYFAALPPGARKALQRVRAAIRAAAPGAVEGFSYRMPVFRLDGRTLVWYAAFTQHISLFPLGAAIRRAHADDLKGCGFSTGTIRFPMARPPSAALVRRLVKARIAELRTKKRP
jgi:uncharacterized protein YdhG (YjbR/CyaY superfamily)